MLFLTGHVLGSNEAEVFGWFLGSFSFLFFFRNLSWNASPVLASGLSAGCFPPPRTKSGCAALRERCPQLRPWTGTAWLCSTKITQTSFFVRISFGAEAFYLVFRLLVALSIMSGDLKLCRECVIVEF